MRFFFQVLAVACCVLALAACNRGYKPKACQEPREYHAQRSVDPVRVPADLDAPDSNASVKVPDLPGHQEGTGPTGDCLEGPPDYFDMSPE